jgi:Glycosyl hydrolases family 43.
MLFEDFTPEGNTFAKDPCVIWFNGAFYLYYTKPVYEGLQKVSCAIGIAKSQDMDHFEKVGEIRVQQEAEGNGICAPGAIVLNGVIHLFYQSYGQFPRDYICHATSMDAITFERDETNPVVKPTGDWNNGRAIDADVTVLGDTLFLYWASRDPLGKVQILGVSRADINSGFHREDFTQACDASILQPELPWEEDCIEAPAAVTRGGKVFMFYAGAYNCAPQQINCAVSRDGVHFTRLFDTPMLPHGEKGSWNESESGHPYFFEHEGQYHLFYQGSDDMGKNWRISRLPVAFINDIPTVIGGENAAEHK